MRGGYVCVCVCVLWGGKREGCCWEWAALLLAAVHGMPPSRYPKLAHQHYGSGGATPRHGRVRSPHSFSPASVAHSNAQVVALHAALHRVIQTAVEVDADAERFPDDWLFVHRRVCAGGAMTSRVLECGVCLALEGRPCWGVGGVVPLPMREGQILLDSPQR